MKLVLIIVAILAVLPLSAADPQPFSSEALSLPVPRPGPPTFPILADGEVILEPGGIQRDDFGKAQLRILPTTAPVRIEYGIPAGGRGHEHFNYNVDAPGPGYHEQRRRAITKDRLDDRNG